MSSCVHHVPGRIRMRAAAFRIDSPQRRTLLRGLRALSGVTAVRLNAKAGSVTVFHDPNTCAPEAILEHFEAHDDALRRREAVTGGRPTPRREKVRERPGAGSPVIARLGAEVGRMALSVLVNRSVTYSLSTLLGPRL